MAPRIVHAMRRMEQEIGELPDFGRFARDVGLSRHRFHHLFVQQTGETPGGFLRRIRLDLAAMRLRWTREPAGQIAHGLGYRSQGFFTHAFVARFGETPGRFRHDRIRWPGHPVDGMLDRRFRLRTVESLRCIAKRYLGPLTNVPENWTDFLALLPPELAPNGKGLFMGLVYDDPQFTAPGQIRYDCCVVADGRARGDPLLPESGLYWQDTLAGLHVAVAHRGCYRTTIGGSYSLILDHWVATQDRYTMADDPAIEVYTVPPSRCAPDDLECEILIPLN